MRATREQGERVRIDLIDIDPEVFTDAGEQFAPNRWRQALSALALLAVAAGAAVAWWPKTEQPEWRIFHPGPVPAAGLTNELVLDQPPGPLAAAVLPPPPVDIKPALGYVFAEPKGTTLTRRWATFRARSTNDTNAAPAATDAPQVDGVPAEVNRVRMHHEVTWGPIAGRTWEVTTNMLDEAQALDFANSVGIVDGDPALAYRYQLAGMQPIGSVAALDCVKLLTDLFRGDSGRGAAQPTLLTWGISEVFVSLGSIAAPADALPLVDFVLGAGRAITIHGVAATVITSRVLAGTVVAWVEDERLVMVAGDASEEELIALAESVRPASDVEWQAIASANSRDSSGPAAISFGDAVPLYQNVDPATGNVLAVTVQVVNDLVLVCMEQRSDVATTHFCETRYAELPLLTTIESNGRKFVVAMVDRDPSGAEVRIKIADGTWTLPLQDFASTLPGLAVGMLLPDDYGVIELWDNGEVAKTLTV